MARNIDGVYDSDPRTNSDAKKYDEVQLQEILDKKLAIMDLTATALCLENKMPLLIFDLNEKDSIVNAGQGQSIGTKVVC